MKTQNVVVIDRGVAVSVQFIEDKDKELNLRRK